MAYLHPTTTIPTPFNSLEDIYINPSNARITCSWKNPFSLLMAFSAVFRRLVSFFLASCLVIAPYAEAAITCGTVTGALSPCIPYAQSKVKAVPKACCSGISRLNGLAKTTPDRQATCQCLKQAVQSIPGINYGLAAGLPGKCGVTVPYKISPTTDCKSVK